MILWCDGGHSAREQMRRDALLLSRLDRAAAGSPAARPVLRLFRFTPPGITLGRAQDPERTLDLERCRSDGVEWAVRPTGGRAIFHDDEWTYSLSCRLDDPDWGGSLSQSYERVSRLVHASLAALGLPVAWSGTRPVAATHAAGPRRAEPVNDPARPSCFASTARHEIEIAGRKTVGSAQRRTASALLQQGSVLLGEGHLRLADYLRVGGRQRARARAALASNAMPGGLFLGPDHGLERWEGSLARLLGQRVRRVSGLEGAFLLTLEEPSSYTSPPLNHRVTMILEDR